MFSDAMKNISDVFHRIREHFLNLQSLFFREHFLSCLSHLLAKSQIINLKKNGRWKTVCCIMETVDLSSQEKKEEI